MAKDQERNKACWSWGEAMSSIRQMWLDAEGQFEITIPAFTFSFGTTGGCPDIRVANNMRSLANMRIVLLFMAPGDKSSAREMVQSPGFDGSTSLQYSTNISHRTPTQDIDSWKACVGAAKKEIYDVYGRGIADAQIESRLSNSTLQCYASMSTTKMLDVTEVVSSEESLYYINMQIPDTVLTDFCAQAPALPEDRPGQSVGSAELSRIAQALEDMTVAGMDISFNHGQSVFSVRGKIITG